MMGIATKNRESGSGGDMNAPTTKAPNHIIRREAAICWRVIAPERRPKSDHPGRWRIVQRWRVWNPVPCTYASSPNPWEEAHT